MKPIIWGLLGIAWILLIYAWVIVAGMWRDEFARHRRKQDVFWTLIGRKGRR